MRRVVVLRSCLRRFPGLALAVLRQGQPLVLRAYGLASVELAVPVTADTVTDRETRYYAFAVTDDERLAALRPYAEQYPANAAPRAGRAGLPRPDVGEHLPPHGGGPPPDPR